MAVNRKILILKLCLPAGTKQIPAFCIFSFRQNGSRGQIEANAFCLFELICSTNLYSFWKKKEKKKATMVFIPCVHFRRDYLEFANRQPIKSFSLVTGPRLKLPLESVKHIFFLARLSTVGFYASKIFKWQERELTMTGDRGGGGWMKIFYKRRHAVGRGKSEAR